ncbi:MAG TPA: heparan-alpha-glucosaminide N-acetyltransferase domain-containing protein [Marmoricola sp.]|nr:heparan-alpha-glucosaminide N-acetyltransferase domain-containing protein [Marmoricola sp.]
MQPSAVSRRIVGLDVARCLAVVGMIATHTLVAVDADGVTAVQQLAGGRSSALFALLAGVSIALMTGGRTPVTGRERRARAAGLAMRALVVAAIGMLLGHLGSGIAVVLTYYGLLFLIGLPFLRLRARSLFLLSALTLSVVPVLSQLLRPHLPEPTLVSPNFDMLTDPWRLLTELAFTGYYPVLAWAAYLFAGMAIGRLDLSRARTAVDLLVTGALVAAAGWFVSEALLARPGVMATLRETYDGRGGSLEEDLAHGLFGTTPTGSWWWLAVHAPHSGAPFDLAHTIGSAMVVIALCLLVSRVAPRLFAVVFGAGAISLTVYSLHVVMRTPPLWFEDGTFNFARHVALVLGIGALFAALRVKGPLETLVRRAADVAAGSVRGSRR